MNLHHLPTLTEVIDEASFAPRGPAPEVSPAMIDLSDATAFEATVSDHAIRRALAERETRSPDISLADAPEMPAVVEAEPPSIAAAPPDVPDVPEIAPPQALVDDPFEQRLREALAPLMAEAADLLAARASEVLASSLRELVAEAVAREFDRLRGR